MHKIKQCVTEFHKVMDIPILPHPQVPSDDRVRLRAKLILEEALEFLDACFEGSTAGLRDDIEHFITTQEVWVDLSEAADALTDIAYIVEGSNLEFGIDSEPVLDEVHSANMRKTDGPIREDGKRLKPPGWVGPDVLGVLRKQLPP